MSARDLPLADLPLTELLALAAGTATRVDPQARVDSGARLGEGCMVRSGAVVPRGTRLGDRVTVGPNAVFVEAEAGERPCNVGDDARIGAGAVIYAGLRIGARAVVRPGAILMQDLPDDAVAEACAARTVTLHA